MAGTARPAAANGFFDLSLARASSRSRLDCAPARLTSFALGVELLLGDQGVSGGAEGFRDEHASQD